MEAIACVHWVARANTYCACIHARLPTVLTYSPPTPLPAPNRSRAMMPCPALPCHARGHVAVIRGLSSDAINRSPPHPMPARTPRTAVSAGKSYFRRDTNHKIPCNPREGLSGGWLSGQGFLLDLGWYARAAAPAGLLARLGCSSIRNTVPIFGCHPRATGAVRAMKRPASQQR